MGVNIQTIKDIRIYLKEELADIYQEPELNAITNLIIKTVLGLTRLHQIYDASHPVNSEQVPEIIEICKELKSGKPVQYVIGETNFYGCPIKVSTATLIPRPETEELVHLMIGENKGYHERIIDFGTGSGCIAIALAVNLPLAAITGIDFSESAIMLARENASINNVKVEFAKGDILNFDYGTVPNAGIIVSNPPYVRNSEKEYMHKNILDFEPHSALFVDDSDPLIFYRAILGIAGRILVPGGKVYFEINEALGKAMIDLFDEFEYSEVEVVRDINNRERIIRGTRYA